MKYTILLMFFAINLFAGLIRVPVVAVDNDNDEVKITIEKIDPGMSGYIVHSIAPEHTAILKNVEVKEFDANRHEAVLKISDFDGLRNNALPHGKWQVKKGDTVTLAFAYSRALLIAPNEQIYHKISRSVHVEWIHPDIFATILSFNGHPTPLKSDFVKFANAMSAGLVFIYLDGNIFTLDIKSFKILSITPAILKESSTELPFYTRVKNIDAAWWGEGSSEMDAYAPHYYELLIENNPKNKKLYEIVKNSTNDDVRALRDDFELEK
jgi:hypothetical protein